METQTILESEQIEELRTIRQPEQDPCKEQGCDDIENCDEICKYRKELRTIKQEGEKG